MTMQQLSKTEKLTNEQFASQIIEALRQQGVNTFCICPGSRNSPFYMALKTQEVEKYFWFEERSGAFFALGLSRRKQAPVAIIVTSGSAAGELLPAAMEAYYTGDPLLLITADRPRRFRGTGAPQSVEQERLFTAYTPFEQDIEAGEECRIREWNQTSPAHLNVCFEEPFPCKHSGGQTIIASEEKRIWEGAKANEQLNDFLRNSNYPLVIVSALPRYVQKSVANFLNHLNAPIILEGTSGLREEPLLQHLRISRTERIWQSAEAAGYPIDGILRIGGVPTIRVWRDLEDKVGQLHVCGISDQPFTGLSWGNLLHVSLEDFFSEYSLQKHYASDLSQAFLDKDRHYRRYLLNIMESEPTSEVSLIHALTKRLPAKANIYLGNSLPIREWDLAALDEDREFVVSASRGVSGIDGQISTFLGLCEKGVENWALIGDLTALYDLAGPWVLSQMADCNVNIVVVNNGGGQIFSRMFPEKDFLHSHQLNFRPVADLWGMSYERWEAIPEKVRGTGHRLIEIIPDNAATSRFWQKASI